MLSDGPALRCTQYPLRSIARALDTDPGEMIRSAVEREL